MLSEALQQSRSRYDSGVRIGARQTRLNSVETADIRSEETTEILGGHINQSNEDYLQLGNLREQEQDRGAERDSGVSRSELVEAKPKKSMRKMTREEVLMLGQILKKKH